MASVRKEIATRASPEQVWAAVRDVGALHTRLAPGLLVDTKLEGAVRVVTFGNGRVVHEPIVTVDDLSRRLVWTAQGGMTTHYNAALQVTAAGDGSSTIVWIADFLPDESAAAISGAMEAGVAIMKTTLDALV